VKKLFSFLITPQGKTSKIIVLAFCFLVIILGFFGYLDKLITLLNSEALTFHFSKETPVSAYIVIKTILVLVGVFWATRMLSNYAEKYFRNFTTVKASDRAILSKAFQIVLYFVAFLILMDLLDIDLKTLTIFSGAVGIGVGFGLQKIASNFISGLILLFEKSARVDDLIELDKSLSGTVRFIGARYTLVETPDGREIMIPNEDFITSKVTNWTFSNTKARVEIPIGIAYGSDLEKAQQLMLDAAIAHPKCIFDPEPLCFLTKFSENAVEFMLFFWVGDVVDGRMKPQSEVMFSIWRKFQENNIKIAFPHRDVYIHNIAAI
jgi:small-conductance mechanosensitive channel